MIRSKINSLIIVLTLSVTNIWNVLNFYFELTPGILNSILILIFTAIALVNNNFRINIKFIFVFIFFVAFFLINISIVDYKSIVLSEFLKFLVLGLTALFISSYEFDYKYIMKYWYKLSLVFFIIIHLMFDSVITREFSYMDFGFIANFLFLGFIFGYFLKKRKLYIILMLYLLFLSILFGHRGSIIVNIILLVYFVYKLNLLKPIYVYIITFASGIIGILFYYLQFSMLNILYFLQENFSYLNSYSLKKIIWSLESESLDTSGRDEIYLQGMELIREKLFLLPSGFGYFQHKTDFVFPHNIFIDMYVIFGVITILFFVYLIYSLRNIHENFGEIQRLVVFGVFLYEFTRLLTGGTFLTSAAFWFVFAVCMNSNNSRYG